MPAYCKTFTLFLGLSLLCLCDFASLYAQSLLLEETFDSWTGLPAVPPGWEAYTSGGCAAGDACYWAHQDSFPQMGLPAQNGCTGGGGFARAHTLGLNFGELPALWSPELDLSLFSAQAPLGLRFCYINPSQQGPDTDILQVSFSDNGGLSWDIQLFISQVQNQWEEVSMPIPPSFRSAEFRVKFEALGNASSIDIGVDDFAVMDSTPVCLAGASVVSSPDSLVVCLDQDADMLHFAHSGTNGDLYTYLITDEQNQVVEVVPGDDWNFNEMPPGVYRLYGVSHTGALMANIGQELDSIAAQICHQLSDNYLTIPVFFLTAQVSVLSDYNGFEVSEAGKANGIIEVESQGGSGQFTVVIMDSLGQTYPDPEQLPAGTYQILVIDDLGCSVEAWVSLYAPEPLLAEVETDQMISCSGNSEGMLAATVSGGVAPYTFEWNGQMGDSTLGEIPAGLYALAVTDANGATFTTTYTLTEPSPLQVDSEILPPACHADPGEIRLAAGGGQAPYIYTWDDGQAGSERVDLSAGIHRCTVADALGCSQTFTYTLTAPKALQATWISETPSCAEATDGSILLDIQGGTEPYSVSWGDESEETERFGLPAGNYPLLVEDAAGCLGNYLVELEAPAPLNIAVQLEDEAGLGTQSAAVSVTGGTPPYAIQWEDGDTSLSRNGLITGVYELYVQDQNGCEARDQISVEGSGQVDCISTYMGFSPNGDGINDTWVMPCITQFPENKVQVLNRWGQMLFETSGYDNSWGGISQGSPLPDGTYYYIIQFFSPTEKRTFKGTLTIIR